MLLRKRTRRRTSNRDQPPPPRPLLIWRLRSIPPRESAMKKRLIGLAAIAMCSCLTFGSAYAINTGGDARQKDYPSIKSARHAAQTVKRGWAMRAHRHARYRIHHRMSRM